MVKEADSKPEIIEIPESQDENMEDFEETVEESKIEESKIEESKTEESKTEESTEKTTPEADSESKTKESVQKIDPPKVTEPLVGEDEANLFNQNSMMDPLADSEDEMDESSEKAADKTEEKTQQSPIIEEEVEELDFDEPAKKKEKPVIKKPRIESGFETSKPPTKSVESVGKAGLANNSEQNTVDLTDAKDEKLGKVDKVEKSEKAGKSADKSTEKTGGKKIVTDLRDRLNEKSKANAKDTDQINDGVTRIVHIAYLSLELAKADVEKEIRKHVKSGIVSIAR